MARNVLLLILALLAFTSRTSGQSLPATMPSSGPAAASIGESWTALADADPLVAWRAGIALAAQGDKAVDHIRARVPTERRDSQEMQEISQWIAELDSEKFVTREEAQRRLEHAGKAALRQLKDALAANPSLEVRTRVERLLSDEHAIADGTRIVRATHILELIGTEPAKKLLGAMADASSWGALEAKGAVARLAAGNVTTMPAAGEKIFAVCNHILALGPDMANKVLAAARPQDVGATDCIAITCPTSALVAALTPGLDMQNDQSRQLSEVPPADHIFVIQTYPSGLVDFTLSTFRQEYYCDWFGYYQPLHLKASVACAMTKEPSGLWLNVSDYATNFGIRTRAPHAHASDTESTNTSQVYSEQLHGRVAVTPGRSFCILSSAKAVGGYHPHHLFVVSFVAIPAADVKSLRWCNYSQPWITAGPEGLVKLLHEAQAWEKSAPPVHAADDKWTRTLPSGAQVRFSAMCDDSANPFLYFTPDGNPSPSFQHLFYYNPHPYLATVFQWRPDAKANWEYLRLIDDLPPHQIKLGLDDGKWEQIGTFKLSEKITVYGQTFKLDNGKREQIGGIKLKEELKVGDQSFTLTDIRVTGGRGWAPPQDAPSIQVGVACTRPKDMEYSVGAVDKKGRLFTDPAIQRPTPLMASYPNQNGVGASLPVDFNDVDHYVLLKRPRVWVTFEDFATRPATPGATTRPSTTRSATIQ
jgi:hypothetical protein